MAVVIAFARRHWLLTILAVVVLLIALQLLLFGAGSTQGYSD